ncbi:hypothetical protein Afil01_40780 [Actinorhabdospora filicis]|uniref:Uncharacterized protein n=1 Tax=Actinorhabdospora filicis TaxID=1785913 RepID=A0A9W6SR86_9ACTN|nr:hypothetical protein [Actinorhabdospora filicis]GLZ79271.1 hypothetical protein Afil01_40780 [Actinorhabdospora filicis]
MRVIRGAADRLLNRLVPKGTAAASAQASYYVFCHCDGVHGMWKNCSVAGSWCTECIYIRTLCA